MTTGRINQVAIVRPGRPEPPSDFHVAPFALRLRGSYALSESVVSIPSFPDGPEPSQDHVGEAGLPSNGHPDLLSPCHPGARSTAPFRATPRARGQF